MMRSQLKNERGKLFFPRRDLNHGPLELKASVLPMSFSIFVVGNHGILGISEIYQKLPDIGKEMQSDNKLPEIK